jgi:hypothetical protein
MPKSVTLDLDHDGKRAYKLGGKSVICSDSFSEKTVKHPKIKLTAFDHFVGGAEAVEVVKHDGDQWRWAAAPYRFPLIVYEGGCEVLNDFFPDAQVGEVKTIWLKCQHL